jgi:phosphoglycerol transferase MdoB-like AlkP superfamily enzyme
MIRAILTEVAIFLIPFILYAVYLVITRAALTHRSSWPFRVVAWLLIAALALVIISLLLLVHYSGAPPGATYVPAHVEDGRLVPGTEKSGAEK